MTLPALKSLGACALLALFPSPTNDPHVFPPNSSPYGLDYAEWSAAWWQWNLEHPVAGHPAVDDPLFNVASGQSGKVWFLATPLQEGPLPSPAPLTRHITIREGTALFVGTFNSEWSDLEGFATEEEQREFANWQGDHVVDLTCTLNGQPIDLGNYRFESEQFSFTAPDPWIFSPAPSGPGNAVADGYYLFLKPLTAGQHVLHYAGGFHFAAGEVGPAPYDLSADVTYVITVTP